MLGEISLLLIAVAFVFLVYVITKFVYAFAVQTKYITGYILDLKVERIFWKATIIAEAYAQTKDLTRDKKNDYAIERAQAIAADVLLQNGLNPREYHLQALVYFNRYLNNLPIPREGGEEDGESPRSTLQH